MLPGLELELVLSPRLDEYPRLENIFATFIARAAHFLEAPRHGCESSGQEQGRLCPLKAICNGIGNGGGRHDVEANCRATHSGICREAALYSS